MIPTLTDLIFIKKGFLSKRECQIIIDEYENLPDENIKEYSPHAFTGDINFPQYSVKTPLIGGEVFYLIHKSIEKIVNEYQDYLDTFDSFHCMRRISLIYPHIYRLMKYQTGDWIHPHTDNGPDVHGSCTINLNEEYTGGLFSFWNGKHKVKLGRGDIIIWPADYFWVHEIEKIQSGSRYSVNCFLRSTPQFLPENIKYNVNIPDSIKNYLNLPNIENPYDKILN